MFNVYSQRNITQEEYQKIITTDTYYWGRSDFDLPLDAAKKQAREELMKQISEFEKSISENDLLKRTNLVKFEVEDNRTRIIFYVAKDSLYVEHIIDATPIENEAIQENEAGIIVEEELQDTEIEETEEITEPIISIIEPDTELKTVPVESGNEIIDTLSQVADFNNFCTQLNRYKRQGKLYDSQSGAAPDRLENCIMAIFNNDILEALYNKGNNSRRDFLTGETTQNPEENYKNKSGIKVIFIKLN
jgi:hypothetical protein